MKRVVLLLVVAFTFSGCVVAEASPQIVPGDAATAVPTANPTPTLGPTDTPTDTPTIAPSPTVAPTKAATLAQDATPAPTDSPTDTPTVAPTDTPAPTPVPPPRPIGTGPLGYWSGNGDAVINPPGTVWKLVQMSWQCSVSTTFSAQPFVSSGGSSIPSSGSLWAPLIRPGQPLLGPVTITAGADCYWLLSLW